MRPQAASTSLRPIMESSATASRHVPQEVVEVGRGRVRILGGFVVAPQSHCLFVPRMAAEGLYLGIRHRPALQAEAAHRIGRELAEVVGLHCAEITLGRDMQTDGFADLGAKALGQPLGTKLLMPVVDAAAGRILPEWV